MSEDVIGVLDGFVVVLDGVMSKEKVLYGGMTAGRFATEVVMGALRELEHTVTAREAVDLVSARLQASIVEECGSFPLHPPGCQLAVFSVARCELWRVGDVHLRVNETVFEAPAPPFDAIAAAFRAALLETLLAEGLSPADLIERDVAREALLPLLSRQDLFANDTTEHRLGYGVINGTTVPDRFLSVIPLPRGAEVVMCTDGYLSSRGTLAEAESELQQLLEADPLVFRAHQATRAAVPGGSFDDRAWVRLRLVS